MTTSQLESLLVDIDSKREQIEQTLASFIPNETDHRLFAAARYSLLGPGKRLRPLLLLLTAESFGAETEPALYPACALEMIHTYSLIHDDLPCMDDDDLRRGRPTLHKVYPEGHAVLTGDFLLTYAFQVLCQSPSLSPEQRLDLVRALTIGAGEKGMIGGQVSDILWSQTKYRPSWPELAEMQIKKTAALFATALEMGAIVANAPEDDRQILLTIGHEIGLAFQLTDDLADGDGSTLLLGIGETRRHIQDLLQSAERLTESLSRPIPLLILFFHKLLNL